MRNREARTLTFDQRIYTETVAKPLNATKTSMILIATGKGRNAPHPIQDAVGALMWAVTMTRPDLSFAAQNLAKFCDDPGPVHWKAAMKALRYFWRTKDLGLTMS
ncbi:unnamed protein product, partial [Ascophyllum nodosum]